LGQSLLLTSQILHDIDETDPIFKPNTDLLVKIDRQGTVLTERLVDTASQGQLSKDVRETIRNEWVKVDDVMDYLHGKFGTERTSCTW